MYIQKINKTILNKSFFFLVLIFTATIVSLFFLPKIKIDNSVDAFFNKNSNSYIKFQQWKKQFGSDELVIIAFSDKNIFTKKNLFLVEKLTNKLEEIVHVDNVRSLTNVNDIIGSQDDFIVRHLVEDVPLDPASLEKIRKEALGNPLYTKNIISKDGKTTAILVEIEEGGDYKKDVIENIKRIMKDNFPKNRKYYLSGLTAIEYYYALYMQEDLKAFMPLMFIVIMSILYFSFRSIKVILLPLTAIGISLSFSMALLYFLGYSINNVTTIIPPLLMAIMIADSIHLVSESMHRKDNGKEDYLLSAMNDLFFPCLLTTLTTSVGFISLMTSRIPPVRELGVVVGISVFFAFAVTFLFIPAAIKQFNLFANVRNIARKNNNGRESFDKFLNGIGSFNEKNKKWILLATVILTVFFIAGILRIKVETSVLEYFKKNSPIYSSTMFIENNISGVHTLNIAFKADKQDYFKNPDVLREIEKIHKFLYTIPEVDKVTSVTDFIKDINMSFNNENKKYYKIPNSNKLISQYMLLYSGDDLNDFIDSRWQWATIRIRLKEHNTVALSKIIKKIRKHIEVYDKILPKPDILGQTVLEVETNNAVTSGQLNSLGLAMFVIFCMMFIVFKSIPIGIVSIVPNILPIIMNFGIMGWLGIRLNSATSMIAAIGIGIVVDDTIHYLHSFVEEVKKTGDYHKAMYNSLISKGRPIILTSIILFFGFGVLAISKFVPTSYFGILSALLMFNALLADLIILPCILIQFEPNVVRGR